MINIIHVSDLHFHRDDEDNSAAKALLDRIFKEQDFSSSGSAHLLITGDITDDGVKQQYDRALDALMPFNGRVTVCPGNHDYGPLGNFYSAESAELFDGYFLAALGVRERFLPQKPAVTRLQTADGTDVSLIGLNSVMETDRIDDFARGSIGKNQLQALNDLVSKPAGPREYRIVYLHHRPQRCNWFLELVDSEDLMAVVNNRVDVLAFGHSGRDAEPPQAKMMRLQARRPYGVGYLLNANASVDSCRYYQIVCRAENLSLTLR